MAVTPPRWHLALAGIAMLALAAATLRDLPQPPEQQQAQPQRLPQTIARIQSGEAEAQAEANAEEPGLVPMAAPCLMRRAGQAAGVDQSWRHAFAAASIATDPALRATLLADLLERAPDAQSRWRIDLARAEDALRRGDTDAARTHLTQAKGRDVPDACRADEAFLAADLVADPQAAAALLDQAVALDPGFWAAQERLAILAATGTGSDPASCEADAVRTLETVVQLGALARRDTQFQRLDRAIAAMSPSGRSALLQGMILRQTATPDAARAALETGLSRLGASACDAILREGLTGMIKATEEAPG